MLAIYCIIRIDYLMFTIQRFCLPSHSLAKDENKLPDFREGERFSFASLALRDGQTAPLGYLTESELIEKMEKHGIGTDASISSHINNIVERNYVHIGDGRTLIPNPLGK